MKMFMVLGILFAVMAFFQGAFDAFDNSGKAHTVAVNYAVYRNAAFAYAQQHKPSDGIIATSSLSLPTEWQALRTWTARMEDTCCYVFGEVSVDEIHAARELFQDSVAMGYAQNGKLMPQLGNAVALPSFIPDGNIVSVIDAY